MVHKFQAKEDYDDVDLVPYQGGYDQAATYGSLKPADEVCGYPRSQFGVEAPLAQYGNERNPYVRGHPGPPIYGGSPKPGAVYGGGRDRSQPSPEEAQLDEGVKTGSGRRKLANGKQPELSDSTQPEPYDNAQPEPSDSAQLEPSDSTQPEPYDNAQPEPSDSAQLEPSDSKPSHNQGVEESGNSKPTAVNGYEVSEESGYRKLRSIYDQEEQRQLPFDEISGYRRPYFGYREAEPSGDHHKPQPSFSEVDQYGYRSLFYGYGEPESGHRSFSYGYGEPESGYRNFSYGYTEENPAYHKPQPTYYEATSMYWKPHNEEQESKPGSFFGEQETVYGQSVGDERAYSGYVYSNDYGYQPNYGEETSGYGGHWPKFADDDPARFGGGSAYVEVRAQNAPAPAPANRSFWW